MSKKRRVFDIDFEDENEAVPAGTDETRRAPMAAAIAENADALEMRRSAEAAIRAENDALAHELVRLKKAGLVTNVIPLDHIHTTKLTRDRAAGRDDELDELKSSIREIGLSNPIRVEPVADGYELIQGWRRLTAFRELREEGVPGFEEIPAAIVAQGEALLKLYRQMVDENMVRRGVSFGELAQLAMAYATTEPDAGSYSDAVELLFGSAGRQKRSYIKSFARLLEHTNGTLVHIEALPRALGLELLKRLDEDPAGTEKLEAALAMRPDRDAAGELDILRAFVAQQPAPVKKSQVQKTAKTTFRLPRPDGMAKCTAADGRIELRLDRDFGSMETARLEVAVNAFFDALDE